MPSTFLTYPKTVFFCLWSLAAFTSTSLSSPSLEKTESLKEELPLLQMVEPLLAKKERPDYEKVMTLLPANAPQAIQHLESLGEDRSAIMNFILGNLYLSTERTNEGIHALKASIDAFPNFLQAHRSLAGAQASLGKLDQTLFHAQKAISLGGADAKLYGLLGYAHYQKGRYGSALSAYQLATMLEPDQQSYQRGVLYSLASSNEHVKTLTKLDELLPTNPHNTQFWLLKANAHLGLKENEKALVAFEVLRQIGNADGPTLSRISHLYFNEGLHDEAVKASEEALSQRAQPSSSLSILEGLISLDEKNLAQRLSKKLKNLTWDSKDHEQRHLLALAQIALLEEDLPKAEQSLRTLIKIYPTQGSALLSLGRLLLKTDRPDEARIFFERAASFEDVQLSSWHELAQLSWRERNTSETLNWLEKVYQHSPTRELMETIERLKKGQK